jgi:hypothetical protein
MDAKSVRPLQAFIRIIVVYLFMKRKPIKYGTLITCQLDSWLEVYKTHTQFYSFLLRNPTTELVVLAAYTLINL